MGKITPNKEQQKCIEKIDGKLLVLAGPGTGKTFTVVNRIEYMVKERGIDPERILCLSFSEAAASEMKKKMVEQFGDEDPGVRIYTYHGFCNDIIGENPEEFELPNNYRVIPETVQVQLLKECIDELEPVAYRNEKNNPYVYFTPIMKQITEIKRFRLTKEEYFKNLETNIDWEPQIKELKKEFSKLNPDKPTEARSIKPKLKQIEELEKKIAKAKEAWDFYECYKAKMERGRYVDFEDMIGFVLDKFEASPAFLEKIANKYDYIMVDEYQDTNKSQNLIVFYLAHALKSQNIFVVGDDDQIIYSFQGANLDTIEGFLKEFPDTEVVCLKENMRSTNSILRVARSIATQDERRLEKKEEYNIDKNLIAANKELEAYDKKVRLTKYYDRTQECNDIVIEIDKLINSDKCPIKDGQKALSEIAVIVKNNDDTEAFVDLFKARNIPFELKDGKSIFKIKSSVVMYYYLQTLVNPELYSDSLYKLLLMPPFNILPEEYKILREKLSLPQSFIKTMREYQKEKKSKNFEQFLTVYDKLQEIKAGETVENIVMETGARTGIFDYYLNEEVNREENVAGLKKIVDVAREFSQTDNKITLEEFIEYLEMAEKDTEKGILTDKAPMPINAVQITTYHSAKGKEYEYVYMPTLLSSKWESKGGSLAPSIPVSKEDYRTKDEWSIYRISDLIKTMYVGMTRAKHTLRLSYPANYGKRGTDLCAWVKKAIETGMIEEVDKSDYSIEEHLTQEINALFKRPYDYKRDFKTMINGLIKDKEYSPTAINSYLNCPRMYFYDAILKLSPAADIPDAMNYGTAVHDTCDFLVKEAIDNKEYPSKEIFIENFKENLKAQMFSTPEQRKIYEGRGINELTKFYHHLTDFPVSSLVGAEFPIRGVFDGVRFNGKIDRIDKSEDGTYIISDYKTGKPQTKKQICVGGDHENYYNQICLYKYYYEKAAGKKVSAVQFLYPMDGESSLTFYPTEDECREVVEKFKNAIKAIENCEFEPTNKKEACKYCPFKTFCEYNII